MAGVKVKGLLIALGLTCLLYFSGVPLWALSAVALYGLWRLGGVKFLKVVVKTAPRDIRYVSCAHTAQKRDA